ncbi:MAG TPA: PBP1A family penicillin-binding protein [Vicinamibacterales bacterium]|nr:PBP1A family penicillin-binding protein [Vicinamibacterales bacterium]
MARSWTQLRLLWRRRWFRYAAAAAAVPLVVLCFLAGYYWVSFGRLIDARLHGERDTVLPRVFARPLELRRGQLLTDRQLIDRLNDLGYAQRPAIAKPGEFTTGPGVVAIAPRGSEFHGKIARVVFQRQTTPDVRTASRKPAPPRPADHVLALDLGSQPSERLTLDAPVLTALGNAAEREKKRAVALSVIPPRMVQAVLAIEDRRFYEHPGVDPIGMMGAAFSYMTGRRTYLAGGSTITQQLVRNVFLPKFGMTLQGARERSLRRKALEMWVSVVLTQRASKDAILEMYLNDIPLGQRGSFAIYGVAEASRLFFGKDVVNLTLAEAATIAGVIQSPSALSPFTNPARCKERRNIVLGAMVESGYITEDAATRAAHEPLAVVQRALEAEAPYFVDYVGQTLNDQYPGLTTTTNAAVDVYTTLDLHLQRLAQDAVREGLTHVDQLLSRRKRKGKAEAALIAVDPKTGEILAFVGGRSYNQSQYDRAIVSRRQPGSVFKPFVYLTAFEQALAQGRTDVTPASITNDEPETFEFDDQVWTPENYEGTYDGAITYRRALAHSRNLGTIHVAEQAGYGNIANLWKSLGVGNPPKPYPSITLGVFEETPFEIATAYTIFPNGGVIRPLKNLLRVERGGADVTKKAPGEPRRVAKPETTFLVTNMMRSVLNEGTAASARANGFALDAAGKTGTTNDLRDAWFAGFTPDLLTVVWVGFDDNQPVGLSGAQAALPIWTQFMKAATAGRSSVPFDVPDGVSFVDICAESGKLPTPLCPKTIHESFVAGTEPTQTCELHRAGGVGSLGGASGAAR